MPFSHRALLGIAAAFLSCAPSLALDPSRPPSQYSQAVWQTSDGLPDNFVQALLQTRDGYLWIGTREGLTRFDGMQFTTFDTRNTPLMRHSSVVTLCEDRRGALWVGTSGGGIVVYRDGRFTTRFDTSNGLPSNYIRSIYEDREGTIWITAHSGGLIRYREGTFHAITQRDGLPSESLRTVLHDAAGALWIGADEDGVCILRSGLLKCLGRPEGLRSNQIRALHQDRQGRIWVGARAGGLHQFDGRRFRHVPLGAELPAQAIRAIVEDRQGSLWVGSEGAGLFRVRENHVARITMRDGLPHNFVRALLEDREGNLWVGTAGGLLRLRDRKVETWTTNEGLLSDDARALLADPAGRVWIGTRAGLNLLHNGAVRPIPLSREWSRDVVRSLAQAPDGSIWIGADTGLFRWRNGTVSRIFLPAASPHSAVRVLLWGHDGRLWIGLWNRLLALEHQRFRDFTSRLPASPGGINALAESESGMLWIGTEEGLLCLTSHSARRFSSRDGLPHDRVTSLHLDADQTLWIGTRGGLGRLRSGRLVAFRRSHGLLSDNILHIAADRHNHLWLTTRRGIMRISRRELEDFASGRTSELHPLSFDSADGMKSAECNGEAQPAGTMTSDGRLWFPTAAGVVVFDPRNLEVTPTPPRVLIEKVSVGRQSWPGTTEPVRIPAGAGDLEIQFTAISLGSPERIRFRYRLEGYDRDWNQATRGRTARYTNLAPGQYRFRVVAHPYDGSWPNEEAAVALVLEPHFYQSPWFFLAGSAFLMSSAWGLYRMRMTSLQRRLEAVMKERARIAREVHDTLMQGVTGVSLQLQAACRRLPADPGQARQRMEHALSRLDQVLAEARHAILELRTSGLGPIDLDHHLRELARETAAEHGLRIVIDTQGARRSLPQTLAVHLLRIARETVTNAIRHSGASTLKITLHYEPDSVRLLAEDDGCGFDLARLPQRCFGLTGMRERAQSIGGHLSIRSAPGQGTKIEVHAPVDPTVKQPWQINPRAS